MWNTDITNKDGREVEIDLEHAIDAAQAEFGFRLHASEGVALIMTTLVRLLSADAR